MADYSGFTFRGIRKDYLTVLRGRKRPSWAPVKRNILRVPGMPGGYLESTDTDVRTIPVPIRIKADDFPDLQKTKEDLASWLITENAEELIFDDEPDRIYMAVVDGSIDLDEIVTVGKGSIDFIVPAAYKLGPTRVLNFTNAASFVVDGSAEAEPYFRLTIGADTTYLAISNGEQLNMIGNPAKAEETSREPETTILNSTASSLTGWTVSSAESAEGSDITGTLATDGSEFYASSFGTSPNWHGPAMKTGLSSVLQDFRYEMGFHLNTTGYNQAGAVIVQLLDASNRVIATLQMTKHYGGLPTLFTKIRAGSSQIGHDVIPESDTRAQFDNDFNGVLRLWRIGNEWTAGVYELVDGVFHTRLISKWTDYDQIATAAATQVQVRLSQRAAFPVTDMGISDIHVYRVNDLTDGEIPYVARTGDVVEFDHTTDIIRVNGEDFTREKAFIGNYFLLNPGANTIVAEPMAAINNVELRWRDRWR